jgi:DNA-directed RNA polymerase specialized sigma24 family protein
MLNQLSQHHQKLKELAKKIAGNDAEDVLQETYLKLYESGKQFHEIDFGYVYLTMRSVYIDSKKATSVKNREVLIDDFTDWQIIEEEATEEIEIDKSKLNSFENLLLFSLYGIDIANDKNEIKTKIKGVSMRKLSIETGIPYITIYKAVQKIKEKLCRD